METRVIYGLVIFGGMIFAQLSLAADSKAFHSAGEIKIGGSGGWDDLSVEPTTHRIFISHADRIVVADTSSNKVIAEILDTPGVHGVALATEIGKAYSSNGKEDKVAVISLKDLKITRKIKVGKNPDAIAYEPAKREVYVFNGKDNSLSIINAQSDAVVATILLPGKPEFSAIDSQKKRIYVNIEDKNSIAIIDSDKRRVIRLIPINGCESPSGLAFDSENQRLFTVCENEKMIMLDAESEKVLASIPSGQGSDGAGYDPALHLAFSSNGKSGTITIATAKSDGTLLKLADVKTQIGARTMTLDKTTHRIYLPTALFLQTVKNERPQPIPGSQKVLVFEP